MSDRRRSLLNIPRGRTLTAAPARERAREPAGDVASPSYREPDGPAPFAGAPPVGPPAPPAPEEPAAAAPTPVSPGAAAPGTAPFDKRSSPVNDASRPEPVPPKTPDRSPWQPERPAAVDIPAASWVPTLVMLGIGGLCAIVLLLALGWMG